VAAAHHGCVATDCNTEDYDKKLGHSFSTTYSQCGAWVSSHCPSRGRAVSRARKRREPGSKARASTASARGGPAQEASGMASALIIAKKRQQREEFQQAITAQEEGTNLRTDKFSTLKPTRAFRCVRAPPAGHQLLRCNTRQCRAVGQRALHRRLTGSICMHGVRGVF
jgi:hypothetical protein